MKNISLLFTGMALCFQVAIGQTGKLRELAVGDRLPDIQVNNILNYQQKSIRLSTLRGKWVILDYWNVYCAPCIGAFPKMEEFIKEFKGQLAIIAFTKDSKTDLEKLKRRSTIARNTKLPISYGDRTLVKLFRTISPHQIWIDPKGYVRYITDIYHCNEANIAAVISGKRIDLPNVALLRDVNFFQPLFIAGEGRFSRYIQQSSYLMGYVDGLGGLENFGYDSVTKKQISSYTQNTPILQLFRDAYKKRIPFNPRDGGDLRGMILEVKDPSRYIMPGTAISQEERLKWMQENEYCYGLTVDPGNKEDFCDQMARDVNRLFNLQASIETRKVKCWTLVRTGKEDKIHTAGIRSPYKSPIVNDTLLVMRTAPMAYFAEFLLFDEKKDPFSPIVLDETGYKERIDIDVSLPAIRDPARVNEELAKYGLELVQKERDLDFLIVRDK